jgi:aryl-alcohol dehydrogenase-like predicted oxidoreductase
MEYVKLGRTGLEASRICLGCMSYGVPDRGNHAWSIDEEVSRPFIKRALEGGINFFDTANRYSLGSSEEILGRAVKDFTRRDEVVIATKVYGRMRPGPNGAGLSRKAIMSEIDASLRRQTRNPCSAALSAASRSARVACGTVPRMLSSAGFITGAPSALFQSPATKS